MKKKLLTVIAAAICMFAMATTVFAASPVAEVAVKAVTDKNGNAVTLTKTTVSDTIVTEAKEEAKKIEKAEVVASFELTAPAGTVFPLEITLTVTGVTAKDTVKILHKDSATDKWETIDAKAGDGTVTFTVNSLSPISVVKVAGVKAPKTGETAPVLPLVLVAVAFVGLAVVSRKRMN